MSSVHHHENLTRCELQPCLELLLASDRNLQTERDDLAAEIASLVARLIDNSERRRATRSAIAQLLEDLA